MMPNTTWATAADAADTDAVDTGLAEVCAGETGGRDAAAEADKPDSPDDGDDADDEGVIDAKACADEATFCADACVGGVADEASCEGGVVEDRSKVGEETAEGVADDSNMTDDDDRTVCALSVAPADCREGVAGAAEGAAIGLVARAACSPCVTTRHDSASSALLRRLDSERITLARTFCLTNCPLGLRNETDREGVGPGTTGL